MRFGGVGSPTTTDVASDGPAFETTSVKTTFPPGIAFAGPVLTIARSAEEPTGTTSVEESFAGVMSPPPATIAVFAALAPADGRTSTVTEIGGHGGPAARTSARVHETFGAATAQAQPAPLAAIGTNPAGRASETVTAPTVGPVPTFETVREKVPVAPLRNVAGACVLRIVRSATTPTPPPALAVSFAGSGSGSLCPVFVAVFVKAPGESAVTVRVSVAEAPFASVPTVHRPEAGPYVPCDAAEETKPRFAGRTSVTTTAFAADGPAFVAVTVNVNVCATCRGRGSTRSSGARRPRPARPSSGPWRRRLRGSGPARSRRPSPCS